METPNSTNNLICNICEKVTEGGDDLKIKVRTRYLVGVKVGVVD